MRGVTAQCLTCLQQNQTHLQREEKRRNIHFLFLLLVTS